MFFRNAVAAAGTALVAASTVSAQGNVNSEIAEAVLKYGAQGLLPGVVNQTDTNVSSALILSFGGQNATVGRSFTLPADDATLKQTPEYQLDVPSTLAAQYAQENFTAMLVDPGAAGQILGGSLVTRHYLANNLKYEGGRLTNSTPAIQSYVEPGPAAGSGAHRYMALVFAQGSDFEAPEGLNAPGVQLSNMTLSEYIDESNIGKIVALSYITVEDTSQGEQTFSTTSAVPSASVEAVASHLSQSIAGSPTAAASGSSGSGGSSGAASFGVKGSTLAVAGSLAAAAMLGFLVVV
ncbi:hypothetical protein BDZ90DRAFT_234455 [Jaminaea rosea]|uniref:PEBP-like protein n=1 Tax=Jaminaea rosea TaxID=1569628 RepID=A0A316UKD3_9BASI|nr:hypothetical protein BDZ90DRAFT_234455 [Jaminaea rosea]PWN25258.1 hypothetical protein BDZ90DRAFT_234455 [Jaminaea rosea]